MRNDVIMHRLQLVSVGITVPQINSTSLQNAPTLRSDCTSLMTISILLRILESTFLIITTLAYLEDCWKIGHPPNGPASGTTPWALSCLQNAQVSPTQTSPNGPMPTVLSLSQEYFP